MGLYTKTSSNTWSPAITARIKTAASTWSPVVRGFVKTASNVWSQFWPVGLTPVIASRVTISKSGSGTITLTGTNFRWTNFSSGVYYFNSSTDQSSWSQMDTGSITNPSVGGSNTKTYVLTQNDVVANTTNYYQFSVAVTSSTPVTATSTSTSVTVEGPRDITNLSYTSVSTTSVSLSWTASLYAGSQVAQYKANSSSTWITHSTWSGTDTSATVTGLSGGTLYDFRILPYTGASATGYYGNPSNVVTVTTTALKPPNIVNNLTASNIQTTYLTLSWTAPTVDATHDAAGAYYYTYNTSGVTPDVTDGTLTFSTSVTFPSGTLTPNTFYYLWVMAVNGDGNGPWTFTTATTQVAVIIPGQVTGLTHTKSYSYNGDLNNILTRITASTKRQDWSYSADVYYNLSWSPATNAASYEVAVNSVNSNPNVATYSNIFGTSFSDNWNQSNRSTVTYYYWVRAVSSDGSVGAWSASSTGGTSTATVVTGLVITLVNNTNGNTSTASPGNTALTYTWTGVVTTALHYSRISATIAGSATGTIRSPGAV